MYTKYTYMYIDGVVREAAAHLQEEETSIESGLTRCLSIDRHEYIYIHMYGFISMQKYFPSLQYSCSRLICRRGERRINFELSVYIYLSIVIKIHLHTYVNIRIYTHIYMWR